LSSQAESYTNTPHAYVADPFSEHFGKFPARARGLRENLLEIPPDPFGAMNRF
jgi:hypothetical protein